MAFCYGSPTDGIQSLSIGLVCSFRIALRHHYASRIHYITHIVLISIQIISTFIWFFSPYHINRSKTQKFTTKIAQSFARSGIQTFSGITFVAIEPPTKSSLKNFFKLFLCAESLTAIGFVWIGINFFLWK